jgi:hypothetical protein
MDVSPSPEQEVEALKRVADLPSTGLVSEEDVKSRVILPMLRALGYDDSDFNYEQHVGKGYVDVVAEHFPSGIVVEAKAPGKHLDQYKEQLESYVFQKNRQDRTTLAILTDGERFNLYGVTGPLWRGGLDDHFVVAFKRADLKDPIFAGELNRVLGRESNQKGAIRDAIESYRQKREERFAELRNLRDERQRIEARIKELEAELKVNNEPEGPTKAIPSDTADYPAAPHILRLLRDREAYSRTQAVARSWLDDQLVQRVDGVNTSQAVSWGLIELKKRGQIETEGRRSRRKVWLKQEGSVT